MMQIMKESNLSTNQFLKVITNHVTTNNILTPTKEQNINIILD